MNFFVPLKTDDVFKYTENDKKIKFLAGGTDLVPHLTEYKNKGFSIIDLSHIEELRYVKLSNNKIKIGSLTIFSELAENKLIIKYLPVLAEASSRIGSVQIRNMATIAGNIVNASPAADSLPVLLALSARIKIKADINKTKIIPFKDLIDEKGKIIINNNELLTEIIIPLYNPEQYFSYFTKIGSRKTVSIARLNAAFFLNYYQNSKKIKKIKIALGALGKKAFRAYKAEEFLKNRIINEELKFEFLNILTETVDNAIHGRYSQTYKRQAIRGIGENFIQAYLDYFEKGGKDD